MSDLQIPLDTVKSDFESHLQIPRNSKILFSGKFGTGKTYFLKSFFLQKETEYETFHLYPINYQIYGNEDIMELVKYDILVELINKGSKIIESSNKHRNLIDIVRILYLWGKDNKKDIFAAGMSFSKLGRPFKEIMGLMDNFAEFKKKIEDGDKISYENFIQNTKYKDISETNLLSELLKQRICKLKNNKKSVLILDDLDRMDPEHIFRILNIFSAYFEKEGVNKFGFDIVILVSDYNNIKSIFRHKYGDETDFSGYIDKFYVIEPYYFDNKKAVINMSNEIAKNIKNADVNLNDALGDSGYIELFLKYFFIKTVECGATNLRELLKATKHQLDSLKDGVFQKNVIEDDFQRMFNIAINVAIQIFSGKDNFIKNIKKIKNHKSEYEISAPFAKYSVTMLLAMNVMIPELGKGSVKWRNYNIKRSDNLMIPLTVDGGLDEELFHDLLIEYINHKKRINRIVTN